MTYWASSSPPVPGPSFRADLTSAFCEHCGHSLLILTAGQKRVLATLLVMEEEARIAEMAGIVRHREFMILSKQIEDRSGLDHKTCVHAIQKLRALGYIESRKGYRRNYHVHRLSQATRNDEDLMSRIEIWKTSVLTPSETISLAGLYALTKKETS